MNDQEQQLDLSTDSCGVFYLTVLGCAGLIWAQTCNISISLSRCLLSAKQWAACVLYSTTCTAPAPQLWASGFVLAHTVPSQSHVVLLSTP